MPCVLLQAEQDLGPPRVTQRDKKSRMLTDLRDRVTTDEAGLEEVLYTDDKHMRRRFPDANKLLSEVGWVFFLCLTLRHVFHDAVVGDHHEGSAPLISDLIVAF